MPVSQVSNEPSEESIKKTLDFLHEKAKSATVVTVSEPDAVRPMMEVCWCGGICVMERERASLGCNRMGQICSDLFLQ